MLKNKSIKNVLRVTISSLIVTLIFCTLTFIITYETIKKYFTQATSIIYLISVEENAKSTKIDKIEFDTKENKLITIPKYGYSYGTLKIPSLNISQPLYYGSTLDILEYGIGTESGSFFPSENGTIITMAHARDGFFKELYTIKLNDEVIITTDYGKFIYKIYDTDVVKDTDLEAVRMQDKEEILTMYTCYPSTAIGYTDQRFFAYAKLDSKEFYK